jgi:hypothetical protein
MAMVDRARRCRAGRVCGAFLILAGVFDTGWAVVGAVAIVLAAMYMCG